jgi:hypothetical protein
MKAIDPGQPKKISPAMPLRSGDNKNLRRPVMLMSAGQWIAMRGGSRTSGHPRESGDPALDSRLRGNERTW